MRTGPENWVTFDPISEMPESERAEPIVTVPDFLEGFNYKIAVVLRLLGQPLCAAAWCQIT